MTIKKFPELYSEINVDNLNEYAALYLENYKANDGYNFLFIGAMSDNPFREDETFKWNREQFKNYKEMCFDLAESIDERRVKECHYELFEFYSHLLA